MLIPATITKDNLPVGIDVAVRKFQEFIHKQLLKSWGADVVAKYRSYGRCYRNKKDNGYIAEVFDSDNTAGGKEYKPVYWDDKLNAISFFGIDTKVEHDKNETTKVHLIYFVNLNAINSVKQNRPDEEIHVDILKLVQSPNYGFSFDSLETGLENVLRDYPGSYRDEQLKTVDMHPKHCFRLNFTVIYNIKDCYTIL